MLLYLEAQHIKDENLTDEHKDQAVPLLKAENITVYRQGHSVFKPLSLSVFPGDFISIRGANGSGKTTLLRCLAGIIEPNEGDLICNSPPPCYIGHSVGVPDDVSTHQAYGLCSEAIKALGMVSFLHKPIRQLSAGQRRRVALARLWESRHRLWILDEPTAYLDAQTENCIWDKVKEHRRNGGAVICATHSLLPFDFI